jgi:hypothetical protein
VLVYEQDGHCTDDGDCEKKATKSASLSEGATVRMMYNWANTTTMNESMSRKNVGEKEYATDCTGLLLV